MSLTASYDATSSDTGVPIDLIAIMDKFPETLAGLILSSGGAADENAMAADRTGAEGGSADNDHAKRTRTMSTGGIPCGLMMMERAMLTPMRFNRGSMVRMNSNHQ